MDFRINGNKASITQKELWVFWIELNNVVRIEKLESSNRFTFKAKEIRGNNVVSEAFKVKKLSDDDKKTTERTTYFEPLDKMPSDLGLPEKFHSASL